VTAQWRNSGNEAEDRERERERYAGLESERRKKEGESVGATVLKRAMVERGTEWQRRQRR
jgi:hypothetical protein